jgi:hypothetical protein
MRKSCAVACGALAILVATVADAQQVATSSAHLPVFLRAGDTVYITEDRGQPEWQGTRDIAAERVTRVQVRRNGVMLGAVIGTAIGIPFGIALKSYANNEVGSEAGALAFPIAIGAGAGLGIDSLLVRPHTMFERRAPSREGHSFGATKTGAHGYIGGGFSVEGCSGCPYPNACDGALALIGGGFAYPIIKGRIWIAADEYSRTQGGYFDASGGVSGVVALGSFHAHRFEPFAQGGPRWGDSGNVQWNVGAGANVWTGARLGLRIEYQQQREYTRFVSREFGPSGPGPETFTDITIAQHVVRAGIVIR